MLHARVKDDFIMYRREWYSHDGRLLAFFDADGIEQVRRTGYVPKPWGAGAFSEPFGFYDWWPLKKNGGE